MNIIDVDFSSEDEIIIALDDMFDKCETLLNKSREDKRIIEPMEGKSVAIMLAQQTSLMLDYTMIVPELNALETMVQSHLKYIASIIQKNLHASSQRALGDREVARLIEGDPRIVKWNQFQAQVVQYKTYFDMLGKIINSRGFHLRSLAEMANNDKMDLMV